MEPPKKPLAGLSLVIAVLVVLTQCCPASCNDALIRTQFLKEYGPHAKVLQKNYSNIEVAFTTTSNFANGMRQTESVEGKYTHLNYYLHGTAGEMLNTKTGKIVGKMPASKSSIEVRNQHYSFTVRKGTTRDWEVKVLNLNTPGHEAALCFLTFAYADPLRAKKTFSELAQDSAVTFVGFGDCTWQRRLAKQLTIEYPSKPPQKVSYFFSPDDYWLCVGLKRHPINPSDHTYREEHYTYEPIEGEEYPVLKRIEAWVKDEKTGKTSTHELTEIATFRRSAPFPEAEFRLTAFGIPEPAYTQPNTARPWYLWVAGIGFGCLVVYGILHRLRQPRKPTLGKG